MSEINRDYYVAIPISTILSEQWKDLQPSTRCVFQTMLTRCDMDSLHALWNNEDIAEESGLSSATIGRGISVLCSEGFVRVVKQGGRWRDKTEYEFNGKYLHPNFDMVHQILNPKMRELQLPSGQGGIYFIGNTEQQVVKIGYSSKSNVKGRIKQLQTGCPYKLSTLMLIGWSSQQGEAMLHRHFAEYRLQGEWFKITGELAEYLEK